MYLVFELIKNDVMRYIASLISIFLLIRRSQIFTVIILLQVVCLIFSKEMEVGFDFSFFLGSYLLGGLPYDERGLVDNILALKDLIFFFLVRFI